MTTNTLRYEYEALGVPRNSALAANRNAGYFDMRLCGRYRTDLAAQTQYCGDVSDADAAQSGHLSCVFSDRKPGDALPMTDAEMKDIIAFLQTLSDGYRLDGKAQ